MHFGDVPKAMTFARFWLRVAAWHSPFFCLEILVAAHLRADWDFHDRAQGLDLGRVVTYDLVVQIGNSFGVDGDDHGVIQVLLRGEIFAFKTRIIVDVEAWVMQRRTPLAL